MKVYRKESKFKENPFWYSGKNSKDESVRCIFDENIKNNIPDKKAFVIKDIKGNVKRSQVVDKETGVIYNNATYYIKSCIFEDMPVEQLDD